MVSSNFSTIISARSSVRFSIYGHILVCSDARLSFLLSVTLFHCNIFRSLWASVPCKLEWTPWTLQQSPAHTRLHWCKFLFAFRIFISLHHVWVLMKGWMVLRNFPTTISGKSSHSQRNGVEFSNNAIKGDVPQMLPHLNLIPTILWNKKPRAWNSKEQINLKIYVEDSDDNNENWS